MLHRNAATKCHETVQKRPNNSKMGPAGGGPIITWASTQKRKAQKKAKKTKKKSNKKSNFYIWEGSWELLERFLSYGAPNLSASEASFDAFGGLLGTSCGPLRVFGGLLGVSETHFHAYPFKNGGSYFGGTVFYSQQNAKRSREAPRGPQIGTK